MESNSEHQLVPKDHSVLIVDDNPANLGILFEIMSDFGFNILVAEDGESAIEQVEYAPPDIIILDVMMPGIDGFETSRRLKENKATKDIPIIFMTALSDTEDKVKGFKAGAVDYIIKPIQHEEVLVRVTTHLTIRNLQKKLQKQNQLLQQEISERRLAEIALQEANQELEKIATIDGLTEVANRRRFNDYINQVWQQMMRQQANLSLIMIDIDFFKKFNDTYGHQKGDDCLKQVAQTIYHHARRAGELVARYGGEEFAVILPNTETSEAVDIAESIRLKILELEIPHTQSLVNGCLTLSLGISGTVPERGSLPDSLIRVADQALYEAKKQGRNRFIMKRFDPEMIKGNE